MDGDRMYVVNGSSGGSPPYLSLTRVEFGAGQICACKVDHAEIDAREIGSAQVGGDQIGTVQFHPT